MKIEVLLSTMNLEDPKKLIEKMNLKKSVIINQVKNKKIPDVIKGISRCYSYQEKGLSKSRNRAIMNSNADICIIADDDLKYEDNYEEIVEQGYKKYPDADIIAFHVGNVNKKMEKAKRKEGKVNFITSMRIQSVQTTFKRKSIMDKNIKFNELFGAGVELYSGEENIFLSDCIKNKLKIYYIPNKIATIQDNESTWLNGYNEQYFNAKGATFYAISKFLYLLFILQYAVRKRKRYSEQTSVFEAIKYMYEGAEKYKKTTKRSIYYMGDFCSNTGPAMVNKSYYPYFKDKSYICKTNNKIMRVLHYILYISRCNTLLISGMSKFHIKAAQMAKKHNKKVIYLMHGYLRIENKLNDIVQEKRTLENYENKMLQLCDKVVCVSEKFCEYLKNARKDLKNKIYFSNNGIEKIEIKERNSKAKDTFTIISVGGGIGRKNNLAVCEAINKIRDIRIRFVVIGKEGRDGEKIKQYNFVEYYEYLPHEKVLEKMRESDLYIQNSYFETFGLAIFEAISMGCKILVSKDVGALSIMKSLEQDMIIKNNEDIQEIAEKIKRLYTENDREIEYIKDYSEYSWYEASKKLFNICIEHINEN